MPMTDEQLRRLNVQPGTKIYYQTIKLQNEIAGTVRLLVSGENGPYKAMNFTDGGDVYLYSPVRASVPDISQQNTDDNSLCSISLSRVSSAGYSFMRNIIKNAVKPEQKVITVTISMYDSTTSEPIDKRVLYTDKNGVSMNENDLTLQLGFENPAKVQYAPFYNPDVFTGLQWG